MVDPITRREFLAQSSLGVGGSVVAARAAQAAPSGTEAADIKPVLYSITYGGVWYKGPALTMEEVLARAKKYGFAGIEIDGKRPSGYALDWPKQRCVEFRKKVEDSGLVIAALATNSDFSSPIPEHREADLVNVKEQIRMASDLNTKIVRLFFAWPGVTQNPKAEGGSSYDVARNTWLYLHKDFSEEQTWDWCRQGMTDASKIAGDYGVTLALQNHRPVIKTHHDVIRMVKEVDSPHLKICLDAPLLTEHDDAYVRQAVLDTGSLIVHSHYGGDFERPDPNGPILHMATSGLWGGAVVPDSYEPDGLYLPFFKALLEIGYHGYIGYELCHPLPTPDGVLVGLEYVDKNTELGLEYIKGIIAQAKKEVAA